MNCGITSPLHHLFKNLYSVSSISTEKTLNRGKQGLLGVLCPRYVQRLRKSHTRKVISDSVRGTSTSNNQNIYGIGDIKEIISAILYQDQFFLITLVTYENSLVYLVYLLCYEILYPLIVSSFFDVSKQGKK